MNLTKKILEVGEALSDFEEYHAHNVIGSNPIKIMWHQVYPNWIIPSHNEALI